jgi:Icc protein
VESVVDIGNWRVTLLDSAVPGSVPGYSAGRPVATAGPALSEGRSVITWCVSTIIRCHRLRLDGADRLAQSRGVVRRAGPFPQVRAVLWGHVHQEIDESQRRAPAGSPSTCIQFAAAARISRSAKRRAIAGCACMPTGGWKPGWSAWLRFVDLAD